MTEGGVSVLGAKKQRWYRTPGDTMGKSQSLRSVRYSLAGGFGRDVRIRPWATLGAELLMSSCQISGDTVGTLEVISYLQWMVHGWFDSTFI